MIRRKLASLITKQNSSHGIKPSWNNSNSFKYKDTIKNTLLDISSNISISFIENSDFSIEMSDEDYSLSLSADSYYGKKRIDEQTNNVKCLLNNNCQPAWIIISTYYACFYLANELAKFYGIYIMNFSSSELRDLLFKAVDPQPQYFNLDSTNISYRVIVSHSDYDSLIKLSFHRQSIKPHFEVWENLFNIINKLKDSKDLEDNSDLASHLALCYSVCRGKDGWEKPSTIRNLWNYTHPYYFDQKGTDLAKKFISCIKNNNAAMSWGSNRNLKSHHEDIVTSIAYLYHVLNDSLKIIYDKVSGL